MEYAGFSGFVVLVLNIWAIVSVIGSRSPTGGKVLWIFAGPRAASATA